MNDARIQFLCKSLLLCFLVLVFACEDATAGKAGGEQVPSPPPENAQQAQGPAEKPAQDESEDEEECVCDEDKERLNVPLSAQDEHMLTALGYVEGTKDTSAKSGVVRSKKGAYPGFNFYGSRIRSAALLLDMSGEIVHQWSVPGEAWQHIELLPNGDVLVIIKEKTLMRIDKDSNVLWKVPGDWHHAASFTPEGDIVALSRKARIVPYIHPKEETVVDTIVRLTANGKITEEIEILDPIHKSQYGFLLPSIRKKEMERVRRVRIKKDEGLESKKLRFKLDVLHTNHVEVFDGRFADKHPMFAKGNYLLCMRHISAIMIMDGTTHEILWVWGPGNIAMPHHPVMLDNGRILIFNNGIERSEIVELDPLTRIVEWTYGPKKFFFSRSRGSNQRLPNGNTLITDSNSGYVYEVTPKKKNVWRFANPDFNKKGERIAIWRMKRFGPNELKFLPSGVEP